MMIRTLVLAAVMAVSTAAVAEEAEKQEGQEVAAAPLSYCEQLGKTAGFEADDLKDFVAECEDKRKAENKAESE